MQSALRITFKNMEPSPAVEARIRQKAAKLEKFHQRLTGCAVVVEARHRHQHKGKLYTVRIDLKLPGGSIHVGRAKPLTHAHEDVYVALRDAFNAAARQIEDHVRRAGGAVKSHHAPMHGKIARLAADHGFIATSEGQEVYFHRNSIVDATFEDLTTGSEVRLVCSTEPGEHGWQATAVKPVGKHHIVG